MLLDTAAFQAGEKQCRVSSNFVAVFFCELAICDTIVMTFLNHSVIELFIYWLTDW